MTKANPAFAFFSDKRGKAPDTDQDPITSVSVGGGGVFSRGFLHFGGCRQLCLVLHFERLPEKELENSKQRERLIYSPLSAGPDGPLSDSFSFELSAGFSSPSAGADPPVRSLPFS